MSRNVVHCAQPAGQGNHFELIPTAQMESQHSVGLPSGRDFPQFVFISQISRPEVESRWRFSRKSWPFWKKRPLVGKFQKCFPKVFMATQIHVLCANSVKFHWPEIGKVVLYLPDEKIRLALPLLLLRGSRPKSVRASSRQYTRSAQI